MSSYKIKWERVTLALGHTSKGKERITHPTLAIVYKNDEMVQGFGTVTEARQWIAEQSYCAT